MVYSINIEKLAQYARNKKRKEKKLKLDKLKGKLRECKFTYANVAEILQVSVTTVSSKMNGDTKFYAEEIRILSKALNLNNDEIIDIFLS